MAFFTNIYSQEATTVFGTVGFDSPKVASTLSVAWRLANLQPPGPWD